MNEQDVVARLYDELIEALREKEDGASDHWRVTVAEIYQDLVPYRRARASLGVEMNADYEHALLRLLAGEGDRVRLEPVEARGELESTLQTSNPDVTLYRKFAACDVQISAPQSFEGAPDGGGPLEESADAAADRGPSSEPSSGGPDRSELRIGPPPGRATEPASAAESGDGPRAVQEPGAGRFGATATCPECERGLPAGRTVLFCPFCGSEQPRVCAECGTSLEPEWSFCVACGEPAGTVPPGG